jgi:hypothetical protein
VSEDGIVTYTPNADFFGSDSFIYTIRDQQGARSNGAAVSITVIPVNDAPVAANDTAVAVRGSSSIISVLDNDFDIDSEIDPASLILVRTPAHGVAVIDALTGTITYMPDQGFVGTDSLQYFISDVEGLASNVATVELAIVDSGTPPTAAEDLATTAEGTPVFIDVAANDEDLDGVVVPATVAITAPPSHGTATINRATGRVEYRPTLGFVGTDTFRYIVRDNSGLASNAAAVSITISEREFPWQNPLNMLDVNGDGAVTARDALWIISEINTRQVSRSNGEIIANPVPPSRPLNYLDVTGDGFIVPGDVLRVISYLNARSRLAIDPPQLAVVAAAFADLDDEA